MLTNNIPVSIEELAPSRLPCQQQPDAVRGSIVPRAFAQTGFVGFAQIPNIDDFFIDDVPLVVPNYATTRLQADFDTFQRCQRSPRVLRLRFAVLS